MVNITQIKHISIGLRPFGLKCVSICYINNSMKLPKVFIPQQVVLELMVVCGKGGKVFMVPIQWGQKSLNGPHTKILEKKKKSPTNEYC